MNSLESFNIELSKIKEVTEELVKSNNRNVFNKLCDSCSSFFDRLMDQPKELLKSELSNVIKILKGLRDNMETLKNYGEFLDKIDKEKEMANPAMSSAMTFPIPSNNIEETPEQENNSLGQTSEMGRKKALTDGKFHPEAGNSRDAN